MERKPVFGKVVGCFLGEHGVVGLDGRADNPLDKPESPDALPKDFHTLAYQQQESIVYSSKRGRAVFDNSALVGKSRKKGISFEGEPQESPEELQARGEGSANPSICQKM